MSAEERPSKRQKPSDNAEDEDDLLKIMLEGNPADQEESAAQQRRLERRKRWGKAQNNDKNPVETTIKRVIPPPKQENVVEKQSEDNGSAKEEEKQAEEEDDFDMFSSSVSPIAPKTTTTTTKNTKKDDFDDEEGYYKPVIGEIIDISPSQQYKVLGIVGKGVFSTVVKAKSVDSDTATEEEANQEVALKLIRNNETMAKAALTEIRVLKKLSTHPYVVELIHPSKDSTSIPEHYNHTVMCFTYQQYNLRDVLQKFGRGVGISLQSVQRYFLQLLSALRHFKARHVLHSDIKPDNILVSSDFSILQVCDFGSATLLDETSMIPTPYLVSRFYRAPEIMLGATPSYEVDLWSSAVTVAELFLGKVLFHGNTNNEMLLNIMQVLGAIPPKQVKQHQLQCKLGAIPQHVEGHYFLQVHVDKATGTRVKKQVSLQSFPTKPLQSLLLKAKSTSDSRVLVMKFASLLRGCLALDPSRRMDLKTAMHDSFFTTMTSETSGKTTNDYGAA